MPASTEHPRWADIQGLVLSAYPRMYHAQYLMFTIRNAAAARRWLLHLIDENRITPAIKSRNADERLAANVNVAISAEGLVVLCGGSEPTSLDDLADRLPRFSYPFVEGIAGRAHRSRILGNTGDSTPEKWQWGGPKKPVHLLLMVFAASSDALQRAIGEVAPPPEATTEVLTLPETLSLEEAQGREHFGFTDGISQPILAGTPDAERFPTSPHVTALGEFVFGYADQLGRRAEAPGLGGCAGFGRNGSYLVFAQYEQHVKDFWDFMDETASAQGAADPDAAERLASKIVGRMPDGTPLVPYVNHKDNDFDFTEDPFGYGCPLGSHVRRSNPRHGPSEGPPNRHRILRRGRSYGPRLERGEETDVPRGLFFMCLNADIERQFEFIQQNWTNNPAFAGLSHERDPLVGDRAACPVRPAVFTIPGLPAPARIDGLPRFVTARGAEYFFLPGLEGLRSLAKGDCGKRRA
jgi:Dyp-type peroxidase family